MTNPKTLDDKPMFDAPAPAPTDPANPPEQTEVKPFSGGFLTEDRRRVLREDGSRILRE